jgi:GMP reductase
MTEYDFEHINLVPRKCIVNSRSQCDTSLKIRGFTFALPIVPANMQCVIDMNLAMKLSINKCFYIMHRFGDTYQFANVMRSYGQLISISVGVNNDSRDLLKRLYEDCIEPHFITIDIAHGHSIKMQSMLRYIKHYFPNTIIIAGNVSTPDGVRDLEEWGADIIKVGIGPGSACTTYPATGFGSRGCQASMIAWCSRAKRNDKTMICADGGIREPGDIAKCLALGADMVMVGGMMSGFMDSPGKIIQQDGKQYKEFWGSASHFQSNKSSRIEGTRTLIEMKSTGMFEYLSYLRECLQSAISYAGGINLSALKHVEIVQKR